MNVWEALEKAWVHNALPQGRGTGSCGPGRQGVLAQVLLDDSPARDLPGPGSYPPVAEARPRSPPVPRPPQSWHLQAQALVLRA